MKLRRFSDEGINRFRSFLDDLRREPTRAVPADILVNPEMSTEIPSAPDVEVREFNSRLDAAQYLNEILATVDDIDAPSTVGLWTWLTLFFFAQVCPPDHSEGRKVGENARYIPEVANYQRYYRHLLAGPYRIFRAHKDHIERASVLLCGPVHSPGEIVEQMVARQEVITNANAVALATNIYFDPGTGSFKRGAAGKGAGAARRLADVLNQLDVTWDLYWMSSDAILEMLPKEFDKFRPPRRA
jgi:hypothetical protein